MTTIDNSKAHIATFHRADAWVEGAVQRQLKEVASLPGVTGIAAMPDIHPGKHGPVGCAIVADRIHPLLVGSDIGCGMGLFRLDARVRKLRLDKAAERLREIDGLWDGDIGGALSAAGLALGDFDAALGTIGGGNHFCELQAIEEVYDADRATAAGLDVGDAFLLVHSGSRSLGHAILARRLVHGSEPEMPDTPEGQVYFEYHDHAVRWAALNRRIIAERAAAALRVDVIPVVDVPHNIAEVVGGRVIHRKGSAPADRGLVPVPGSRGTLSYLVAPNPNAPATALASLAHGAGRKYDRGSMAGRVGRTRSDREALERNPYGGIVVCEDRALLVEEAPLAYKAIEDVIADLVSFGLAHVVASFRPLVTFKKTADAIEERDRRSTERDRDRDRQRERERRDSVRNRQS